MFLIFECDAMAPQFPLIAGKRVGHVIHVVGPDFRNGVRSWDVAATELGYRTQNNKRNKQTNNAQVQ
jgi:hypothetical protein